jgi:DNA (cytosine-5)-methyltransferase 1
MTYAGGFDVGVQKHFDLQAKLEDEKPYCAATYALNFPHVPIYPESKWPLKGELGTIDAIFSNPPCAPFSIAGATMRHGNDGWRQDGRVICWHKTMHVLEKIRPRIMAVESVCRAFTAARELMDQFTAKAHSLGYSVTHLLVDAQWHGVPQKRRRYFFIAHDVALTWDRLNYGPPTTVWETIGHMAKRPGYVPPIKPVEHHRLIKMLPQGEALRHLWERENPPETHVRMHYGVKGRPRMFIHRLYDNRPMGTITGNYFIHPFEDRFLGMDELKVLNSFPDDYQFAGKPHAWASEIARGVCPHVAEFVARHAARAIREGAPDRGNTYLVDLRTPQPLHLTIAPPLASPFASTSASPPPSPLPGLERPRVRVPAASRPSGAIDPTELARRRGRPPSVTSARGERVARLPSTAADLERERQRAARAREAELRHEEAEQKLAADAGKFSYEDVVALLREQGREPPNRR